MQKFYLGLHMPSEAWRFPDVCLSINILRQRKKPVGSNIMLDSGAFTELSMYGHYRHSVETYAKQILRLLHDQIGAIEFCVAQDYMCEPFILQRTGMTVSDHQRLTIERYDELCTHKLPIGVLPVLQGYLPIEYLQHLKSYGSRLAPNARVGVGSVCKRNTDVEQIIAILSRIKDYRPDLRLHGFGIKISSLANKQVQALLYSADSMAWSFAARKEKRDANSWLEARDFLTRVYDLIYNE